MTIYSSTTALKWMTREPGVASRQTVMQTKSGAIVMQWTQRNALQVLFK